MSRFIAFSVIVLCVLLMAPAIVGARAVVQDQTPLFTAAAESDDAEAAATYAPPISLSWMHTGQIGATAANNGTFGTHFTSLYAQPLCDGDMCSSFESPENSGLEYLFAGAIWIGGIVGNDTLVSVAADGWFADIHELLPPVPSASYTGMSDQSFWMLFTDTTTDQALTGTDLYDNRPHLPLNVRVANRVHAWYADAENQTIVYDMVITNIGDEIIEGGYVAFYFDPDIYYIANSATGFFDDLTGSIRDAGIGYAIDNTGDPGYGGVFTAESPTRLFAFKPLTASFTMTDTSYNWWLPNGDPTLDYGPQPVDEFGTPQCDFGNHIGTPTGDLSKYCMMSHPGWDFDQIYTADSLPGWTFPKTIAQALDYTDGYDTRFLMSFGPFTLMPDSSVRILYTTFTGDSVIHVADNIDNLPLNPDQYLANLDFSHVLANAGVADDLAQSLIDPLNPVTGLYTPFNDPDYVVMEWDPWGFADVEGYEIYLYPVPFDSMPYAGIVPPWIRLSAADLVASVDQVYQHSFTELAPYGVYAAAVANRSAAKGIGAMSQPLPIIPGGRPPAPQVISEYAFAQNGGPAILQWSPPEDIEVAHYNIYKFANAEEAQEKYYPHYDTGEHAAEMAPTDSFFVGGVWYFYYGMKPYTFVGEDITTFSEYTADSTVYVVTAVTPSGVESEFSSAVTVFEVPERTRDILVLAQKVHPTEFVIFDSLSAYYDRILAGYDYDIYNWWDTLRVYGCRTDWWYDVMSYKMVIVDGGWRYDMLDDPPPEFCPLMPVIQKYALSQGLVAYFGSFIELAGISEYDQPGYYPAAYPDMIDVFGVDSLFATGSLYYVLRPDTVTDQLGGFITAEADDMSLPNIHFDPALDPSGAPTGWPDSVAPMTAAFFNNDNAVPIYTFRSKYPSTSLAEGLPVGIRSSSLPGPIYSFGFRPWYMQQEDMTALVDYLMSQTSETISAKSVFDPDTLKLSWAYDPEPMAATVYIGNLSGGYSVDDIDPETIYINGGVAPTDVSVIPVHADFDGPVLALDVSMHDFLVSYGPLWGRQTHPYVVSATMSDGAELLITGNVFIDGLLTGDVDGDGRVNVGDAIYLINYLFRDGDPPLVMALGDANGDCRLDLGDAVYLINYIFREGPEPRTGCAE